MYHGNKSWVCQKKYKKGKSKNNRALKRCVIKQNEVKNEWLLNGCELNTKVSNHCEINMHVEMGLLKRIKT